jgi:hypothetical protein
VNGVHAHIKDQILGHSVTDMSRHYTNVPQAPLIEAINTLPVPDAWRQLWWMDDPVGCSDQLVSEQRLASAGGKSRAESVQVPTPPQRLLRETEEDFERLRKFGAGEGIRTLDPNLGKVVLGRHGYANRSPPRIVHLGSLHCTSRRPGAAPPSRTCRRLVGARL